MNRKRKKYFHKVLTILLTAILASGILYSPEMARAATYTFVQTDWSGGSSGSTAVHPTNQTGWTMYSSASTTIGASANLKLNTNISSVTQTDNGTTSTGFNLTGRSLSQTEIIGTGDNASVKLSQEAVYGSGADGAITISTTTNINTQAIASGRTCADGINYNVYSLNATSAEITYTVGSGCLSANDKVLLINLRGNAYYGSNGYYGNVGNYEILTVQSIDVDADTNAKILTFTGSKTKYYGDGTDRNDDNIGTTSGKQKVILQRVPQYTNVTVQNNGSLTASAWDDKKGGVLAFYASGAVDVQTGASINMQGMGYRGTYNTATGTQGESRPNIGKVTTNRNDGGGGGHTDAQSCAYAGGGGYGTAGETKSGQGGIAYGDVNLTKLFLGSAAGKSNSNPGSNGGGIIYISASSTNISGTINNKSQNAPNAWTAMGAGGSVYLKGGSLTLGSNLVLATQGTGGGTDDCSGVAAYGGAGRIHLKSNNISGTTNPAAVSSSLPAAQYYSSGVFTSGVIDFSNNAGYNTLTYVSSTPANTSLTIDIRAGSTDSPDANWTSWQTNVASGADISSLGAKRYFQYRANLSATDTGVTPSLDSVTINFPVYELSGSLISSAYNSGDSNNAIGSINWDEDASLPTSTTATVFLRTASSSDGLGSGTWYDFTSTSTGCSKNVGSVSCPALALPSALKDSSNDQWWQYKLTLTSDGVNTATVAEVRIQYVVNAPPEFNPIFGTNGVSVSQIASSTDANWGKVWIQYAVRDPDTNTGSSTPGYVTPSFEYNLGSGWTAIGSQYLAAGDADNKAVSSSTYVTHSATWDAKTQTAGNYSASAQVRVTVNDNEPVNNTTSTASASFILDTKNPVASSTLNVASGTISINLSDNSNIEYRLSNNSDFSGANWTTVGANSTSTTLSWTAVGVYPTVYINTRDIYSNVVTSTVVAPSAPANLNIKDVSNVNSGEYQEFISWSVYSATSSASFVNYKLYRSTDSVNYSLLTTITDVNVNYYRDNNVASSTTYYYKATIADADGDISNYSEVVNDLVDGQGGTDNTAPTISNVSSTVQATWTRITWTTDELANSEINYSASSTAYNLTASSTSYLTSHEITLSGLTPNTLYYYRVKSTDVVNNLRTNDNNGAGYSFTTSGGPIISDVAIRAATDNSATITWNTNKAANSYVVYSTNLNNLKNNTSVSEVGSSTLVSNSPYQHLVTLTGLNSRTTYYYYVKSTDSDNNTASDNNAGNYYNFNTTYDTKAPVISNVSVPIITKDSVIILWQTDELATGQAEYGGSAGSYTNTTNIDSTLSIYHTATVTGLSQTTKYYFRVKSKDAENNEGLSTESDFTTSDANTVIITVNVGGGGGSSVVQDTAPPDISGISIADITPFGATINFNTSEETVGFVNYGRTLSYELSAGDSQWATSHSIKLVGLRLGTGYNFVVKAMDKAGNTTTSENQNFTTKFIAEALESLRKIENIEQFQEEIEKTIESILPSVVPPYVGKPEVVDVTENSAIIKWKTNVNSFSAVALVSEEQYDPNKENPYIFEFSDTNKKVREHSILATGLTSNTKYHFTAKSFSLPQAIGRSADATFITKAAAIQARVFDVKNNSFRVVWSTEEPSTSIAETKNLADGSIIRKTDEAKRTYHDIIVENLAPGTAYEIKVSGYNEKGNLIEGGAAMKIITSRDISPPVISNLKIDNALVPGRTDRAQSVISWRTDEPATSIVEYGEGTGKVDEELSNKISITDSFVQNHTVIVSALKPGILYRIKIGSTDVAGNKTISPARTVIMPKQAESIVDIVIKNFEETFQFLKNLR